MKRKNHDEEPTPDGDWKLLTKEQSGLEDKIEAEILKNKTIVLHGELDQELCSKICKRLLYLHFKKAKDIYLILNSIGGEVYHGLLIFNTLEDLKKKGDKITVEARGLCASMGLWILLGGSERTASKYTRFLLHETWTFTYGKVSELKEGIVELEKMSLMLDQILVDRSKLSLKELQQKTKKKDWWLSAEEALKYGIIDRIV